MIKAVIFDFDGLIIDTESFWYKAYRDVLKEYGIELSLEKFSQVIGTENHALYDYLNTISGGQKLERAVIENEVEKRYDVLMTTPVLRDGVIDYLRGAKEKGLRIGLASSSSGAWVERYLKLLGIYDLFETIQTKEMVKNVKPDPELYRLAVNALGVEPEEALAFEDSLNGLKAARAAGLKCVIVPNPVTAHLPFENYHHRLTSMGDLAFHQLLEMIDQKCHLK
ncbi:MAG: HAD family hydrolase [Tuberibacillus sp.]